MQYAAACPGLYIQQAGTALRTKISGKKIKKVAGVAVKSIVPPAKSVYTGEREENMENFNTVPGQEEKYRREDLERLRNFCLMDDDFMFLYRHRYKNIYTDKTIMPRI